MSQAGTGQGTLGKYEIRGKLGRGAMGVVLDGWDPLIGRRVAIKTVPLMNAPDPEVQESLARFKREAQAAGRLSHPNIVGVYDYGETDSAAYIVMEFVSGQSLKERLDTGERFSLAETVRMMEQMLAALQFSHDRGVVHRDIKGANVMLTQDGQVKLADFGVARIEGSTMTQDGSIIGTPAYMSPEQLMGQPADARSDIYSAGVVLYQLLAGERPFDGSLASITHKVLNSVPPRPSEIALAAPPELDAIVSRAMSRRPHERYASASAFSAALVEAVRSLSGGGATPATQPPPDDATAIIAPPRRPATPAPIPASASQASSAAPPAAAKPRGRGGLLAGGAVVVLLIAAAGGWYALHQPPTPTPTPAPIPPISQPTPPSPIPEPTPPIVQPSPPSPAPTPEPTPPIVQPAPQLPTPTPTPEPTPPIVQPSPPTPTPRPEPTPPVVQPSPTPTPRPEPTPPIVQPSPPAPTPRPEPTPPVVLPLPAPTPAPALIDAAALRTRLAEVSGAVSCAMPRFAVTPVGNVSVSGPVGGGTPEASLQSVIRAASPATTRFAWNTQTVPDAYCGMLDLLRPILATSDASLALSLHGDVTQLHAHEPIKPDLRVDFPAYIQVDYLASDGSVTHLFPSRNSTDRIAQPGVAVSLDELAKASWVAGVPFGTDMIVAVASSAPLFAPRRLTEDDKVQTYVPALRAAIEAAKRRDAKLVAQVFVLRTMPQ